VFRSEIHSLLRRNNSIGSADIIDTYFAQLRDSRTVIDLAN